MFTFVVDIIVWVFFWVYGLVFFVVGFCGLVKQGYGFCGWRSALGMWRVALASA